MSYPKVREPDFVAQQSICIGRYVETAWAEDTVATVNSTLPGSVEFVPRVNPAVTYVNSEELTRLSGGSMDQERAAEHIRVLLASLTTNPDVAVSESITEGVSLDRCAALLKPTGIYRGNQQIFRLQVRLFDGDSDTYECGYQLEGEKRAIRNELGLVETGVTRKGRPRPWLKLGTLLGVNEDDKSTITRELHLAITRTAPLTPVGPISV